MKKAYYARCMAVYGTPVEYRDIKLIESLGYEVIEFPDQDEIDEAKKKGWDVMEHFFKPRVGAAHTLFFRALPSGHIPAGVSKEIDYAQRVYNIAVLEMPQSIQSRSLSVEETREYLKDVGQR